MKAIPASFLAAILAATPVLAAETGNTATPAATATAHAAKPAQKVEPQKAAAVTAKPHGRRHRRPAAAPQAATPKADTPSKAVTPSK